MATTAQRLKKLAPRIAARWKDEDGVWIELKSGWQDVTNPTCHTIHEDTWKEALDLCGMAVPCDCRDCAVSGGSGE